MILVGNQRGGASDLSAHLMKTDNERVEVYELRGFVADDLHGALQESYAVSRATKCKQHLFSLSLNPPPDAEVDDQTFTDTIDRIEGQLGLNGQPRAIVFHEKNGRRHAHAVWSRIDTEQGKAVQLSFTHNKLQEISRDIYIERGWRMPDGFVDREFSDPRNFSLAEWQQSKRSEKDPQKLKGLFQDSWAISDSGASFRNALEERGFFIARGDRRGFVAVDHTGEAYSLSRWVGVKSSQLEARLGAPKDLPSIAEAQLKAVRTITTRLEDIQTDTERQVSGEMAKLDRAQEHAEKRHQLEAKALGDRQNRRQERERAEREARFRRGLLGFWDRLSGRKKRIEAENALQAKAASVRDTSEKEALSERRERMVKDIALRRAAVAGSRDQIVRELTSDVKRLKNIEKDIKALPRPEPSKERPNRQRPRRRNKTRDGPERER